jgi:hypothetical protein
MKEEKERESGGKRTKRTGNQIGREKQWENEN